MFVPSPDVLHTGPGRRPSVGRQEARQLGRPRDAMDAEAARIGLFVHRSPGAAYGMATAASVRSGAPPIRVGIVTGAAAFVAVDEGVNSAFFTPPPQAYPAERHLRGVVGAILTAVYWLGAMRP